MKKTFTDGNGVVYHQIYKKEAHKLYDEGNEIVCCPSKLRPFGFWNVQCVISQKNYCDFAEDSFDKAVNSFEFYNCNNETGKYASFYIAS